MTEFENKRWENLPDHIIVHVMSFLSVAMRHKASLTCRSWHNCFQSQYLWKHFDFWFYSDADDRLLKCVPKYGQHLKSVVIQIHQQLSLNRENACQVIRDLARFRSLHKLSVIFLGENPYFYAGLEFIDALKLLFAAVNQCGEDSKPENTDEAQTSTSNVKDLQNKPNTETSRNSTNNDDTDLTEGRDVSTSNGNQGRDGSTSNVNQGRDGSTSNVNQGSDGSTSNVNQGRDGSTSNVNQGRDGSTSNVNQGRDGSTSNVNQGRDGSTSNVNVTLSAVHDYDESSNMSNNSIYLPVNVRDPTLIREGQLREVDLKGLAVDINDSLISLLAVYHHKLEKLNIQNEVYVVNVKASCILQLVQNCRKLRELHLYMCSMSERVLECFAEENRTALEHLSLLCRRAEKTSKELSDGVWTSVVHKLPRLRVTLIFDHTCPLFRITEIMKPQIPVSVLRLETFTYIYDEVMQAANYYGKCLETLVLETSLSRNSPELNSALIMLAQKCKKLKSLHVFCVLEKATIDKIFELHPKMKETKRYTLEHTAEPQPWYAGRDAY